MHNLYNTGCGAAACNAKKASTWQLADGKGKPFNKKIFDAAAKHVHEKGTVKPTIVKDKPVKDLIKETNRILTDAVNFGIADNVIPPTMLKALQDDVYLFSGMKAYAELKTASALLLDEQGKRKPFAQFAADVEKVHKNYDQRYLEAEYYFATSSAQAAASWAALDDTGRYNLQYRTAGDEKVRDSHNALRDTTLPPDDAFWQSYYPPNGWRCRCNAVEVSKERYKESDSKDAIAKGDKATTAIGKDGKNALAIFRFNPGAQKIIFPPTHPYKGDLSKCGVGKLADGSGQDEKCKVAAEIQKQIPKETTARRIAREKIIYDKPLDEQYDTIYTDRKTNATVKLHQLTNTKAEDHKDILATAKAYAKTGKNTFVLPEIYYSQKEARSKVLKGLNNKASNPDLLVEKTFIDLKRPKKYNNVVGNANEATSQGAEAVISDKHFKLTKKNIEDLTKAIFNDKHYKMNNVHFLVKGNIVTKSRTGNK